MDPVTATIQGVAMKAVVVAAVMVASETGLGLHSSRGHHRNSSGGFRAAVSSVAEAGLGRSSKGRSGVGGLLGIRRTQSKSILRGLASVPGHGWGARHHLEWTLKAVL